MAVLAKFLWAGKAKSFLEYVPILVNILSLPLLDQKGSHVIKLLTSNWFISLEGIVLGASMLVSVAGTLDIQYWQ